MLRRGFTLADTDRVLVIEDVRDDRRLDARDDSRWPEPLARRWSAPQRWSTGARGTERDLDVPFTALLDIALPTYEPSACPLCAQGLAVVKPGSRPVVA